VPNRPNIIGSKRSFTSAIRSSTLTNTIDDAIDSPITSIDLYPQAYTATLNEIRDERVIRSLATDVDVPAGGKIAFGLFLSDVSVTKGNVIYTMRGSLNFLSEGSSSFAVYPVFGQLVGSTVTASTAAASNQMNF